ncbi:MAG: AbrB/MazE/SpoVT family DNA-binding domain-containing protein [Verrucomicrobia bacterium]|jgi:bifunctional DNA-binding transcriptional regulator/antitoxin component of YhaV-PrlF toxin-antitoxin module|nr:AbrB/MazE/SpoVT family DNA-binding domain-containing protein [Verrucomicrobiota bacterium]
MSEKIIIGQRGVLTLPAKLRKRYSLEQNDELMVEETAEGLLLRPCVSMPIEFYTEERIAEFTKDDEAIGAALAKAGKS